MRSLNVLPALLLVFTTAMLHKLPAETKVPSVPTKEDLEFVEVIKFIPNLVVDLPYASEQNFFKKRFYSANRCFLRRGVAERLAEVQKSLNAKGLGLKLWDATVPAGCSGSSGKCSQILAMSPTLRKVLVIIAVPPWMSLWWISPRAWNFPCPPDSMTSAPRLPQISRSFLPWRSSIASCCIRP